MSERVTTEKPLGLAVPCPCCGAPEGVSCTIDPAEPVGMGLILAEIATSSSTRMHTARELSATEPETALRLAPELDGDALTRLDALVRQRWGDWDRVRQLVALRGQADSNQRPKLRPGREASAGKDRHVAEVAEQFHSGELTLARAVQELQRRANVSETTARDWLREVDINKKTQPRNPRK